MAPRQGHQMRSADRPASRDPDLDFDEPPVGPAVWHETMDGAPQDGRPIVVRESPDTAEVPVVWKNKRRFDNGRWRAVSGWCLHATGAWLGFEPAEWAHWDFLHGAVPAKEKMA